MDESMTEPVVTQVNQVVINKMTQEQYNQITPSETELYLITDAESSVAIDNNTITKNQSNQNRKKIIKSWKNKKIKIN